MRRSWVFFFRCIIFATCPYHLASFHLNKKWSSSFPSFNSGYRRHRRFIFNSFFGITAKTELHDDLPIRNSEQDLQHTKKAQRNRVDSAGLRRTRKSKQIYRIQYSINFQRHVVQRQQQNNGNWSVVESFWWLDEAISTYPDAKLMPIRILRNPSSTNSFVIAGDITNQSYRSYPLEYTYGDVDNVNQVRDVLVNSLKWYPGQVDQLLEKCPSLVCYPPSTLEERIQFLLAPLPPETILQQVNVTDDIDWPKLLYNVTSPRGAGMSLSQVAHALQVLPDPFLLRFHPFSLNSDANITSSAGISPQQFVFLYDQTPSVVLQMVHTVLDLWLSGANSYESVALAYLHWKGWEWRECRVVLHAFPSIIRCRLEPTWELFQRGASNGSRNSSTVVRKQFIAESLQYLQMRLHLRPWHINSMLKTHPRLSGYSVTILQRNLNFLQDKLCLASVAVRSMILLMPSLLGTSSESINSNIRFWMDDVGLTLPQLQQIVTQKPTLLHYSVPNNLQPKLLFFLDTLSIEKHSLPAITIRNPMLWGRSLSRFLATTAESFCEYCDNMTYAEFGQLIVRAPEMLSFSWNGNLKLKLKFFETRLELSRKDIKAMVQKSPRILFQSISSSLEPKIKMIEAIDTCSSGRCAIQRNPSLLLNSKSLLRNRISRLVESGFDVSLADALCRSSESKSIRNSRSVILVSDSQELEFTNVQAAAVHARTSTSHMYRVLRSGNPINGQRYIYSDTTINVAKRSNEIQPASAREIYPPGLVVGQISNDRVKLVSHLTITLAGAAFPPEDTVRGRRRAGGMALYISSWTGVEWRCHCSNLWKGWHVRVLPDGPTIILGYPYIRPSRPRCSLYACREALRVARKWLQTIDTPNAEITILTESNYVLNLLHNVSDIAKWGSATSKNELVYNGPLERCEANVDILHPLAMSFLKLVEQDNVPDEKRKAIVVSFQKSIFHDDFNCVRNGAQLAAKLMYYSVRR